MRASNLVIGTTTLTIVAIGFIGLLGVRKYRAISGETRMRIVFEGGSASGLRRGGSVNFDGVQVGEVISLKLDNPRKVVAVVRVDKSAPIRKDTVVGLEFQGLTGIAAISMIGGEFIRSTRAGRQGRHSDIDRGFERTPLDPRYPAQC